jgi:hypothetical protein
MRESYEGLLVDSFDPGLKRFLEVKYLYHFDVELSS